MFLSLKSSCKLYLIVHDTISSGKHFNDLESCQIIGKIENRNKVINVAKEFGIIQNTDSKA